MTATSPFAPESFPSLPEVKGVRLAAYEAGLRYQKRADLFLAELVEGTTVAGTFTRSLCPSAPVDWCRKILGAGSARAVVCNAGNANAFTGRAGETSAALTAFTIAAELGCDPEAIYLASTGVIGETLDDQALIEALPALVASESVGWEQAAVAIGTTDTFPKGAGVTNNYGGTSASVVGVAKGSGMIAPDMATMLGFVFTDLAVTADALQEALSSAVETSFNRVTVDSDTSTSDTVLMFATGQAGNEPLTGPESAGWETFTADLDQLCLSLAHQIVQDGEGASKFIEIEVAGAASDSAAKRIAFAIGNSPLVKTAIAAEDANWGRIVMAVGKAGEQANRDRLAIWIGDEQITEGGVVLDGYSEDRANLVLKQDTIKITVDVGVGDGRATIWTCDLTHGYIEINAGYRS